MKPTVELIPLQHLASGDRFLLQVYQFAGAQPGKKVYIQANLHGNELAGNAVIHQLMEWLTALEETQLVGEIWLLPVCNPPGVNQRSLHYASGRFSAYDGDNWNRIFWNYQPSESELTEFAQAHLAQDPITIEKHYRQRIQAQFATLKNELQLTAGVHFSDKYRYLLQSLCQDASCVIDLHTSVDFGTDYVYYFRDRQSQAALFGLELAVLLDRYDGNAFDEAFIQPWLALEAVFAKLGRSLHFDVEAYTFELGSGMQMDSRAIARALVGIKHYLVTQGIVVGIAQEPLQAPTQFATRRQMKRYYATVGGMVQQRVMLGSWVTVGDLLYEVLSFDKTGEPPRAIAIHADEAGFVFDVAINRAVNEGEYVLGLVVGLTPPVDRHNEEDLTVSNHDR